MTQRHSRPATFRPLRYLLAFLLIGGCVLFIWSNSLQPPEISANHSRYVAELLRRVFGKVFGAQHTLTHFVTANVRKIAHAVEFAALGATSMLTLWILGWINGHTVLHGMSFVLFVAVADETIQIFTGRGASVADIVLDFAGGMGGIILALVTFFFIRLLLRMLRP